MSPSPQVTRLLASTDMAGLSRPQDGAPSATTVATGAPQLRLVALAIVVALVIGFYTITTSAPADKLAETYIKEHLQTLGVTMNARADSMQTGSGTIMKENFPKLLTSFSP